MMGPRQVEQGALFYNFSLDAHVPADHLLRSIDRFVDLSKLRRDLAPFYSSMGRPSVDPELMIRMLIIGYCFGIRSERRLCEEVHFTIVRDVIRVKSVRSNTEGDDVGYIRITQFNEQTTDGLWGAPWAQLFANVAGVTSLRCDLATRQRLLFFSAPGALMGFLGRARDTDGLSDLAVA
jgi:hypothetical protein